MRDVLAGCGPFDDPAGLQAVFNHVDLFAWRDQVPSGRNKQARVDNLITFLYNIPYEKPNPLLRFLTVLAEQSSGGCQQQLTRVKNELSAYLESELFETEKENVPTGRTGNIVYTGGGDYIQGNKIEAGDVVQGDKIERNKNVSDKYNIGNINAEVVAAGDGATATKNEGDTYSGDFRGAILNLRSTLNQVTNSIGSIPMVGDEDKARLEQLVKQLETALADTVTRAPDMADEAEAVADLTESLVATAAAEKPNKTILQITGDGLKKAAQNLVEITPNVLSIATQIVTLVATFAA
jgi:hypothetical protein